nr:reverse transcriptase domain-containing protein [Tanacetum cinerariifolium]
MNTASSSGSGTLPSNTITNSKEDLKGITTQSGIAYKGPTIPTTSSPPKVVKHETEGVTTRSGVAYPGPKTPTPSKQGTKVTKDQAQTSSSLNTAPVQPSVIQPEPQASVFEPVVAPVSAPLPNVKPSIPYPSRRDDEKRRDQANGQIEKFYEIFKEMSFEISFADALIRMPKFASTMKALIRNKEKLNEMARTTMNEHCSAVILNKLPRKLAVTFNLDQTARYSSNYDDMSVNRIDVIDVACEEYSQEILGFSVSGNPTPSTKPIIFTSSPTLTSFEDSDFLLEETDAFLATEDEPISPEINDSYYDLEGDILLLEEFLNDDPSSPPLPPQELKVVEPKSKKSSIDEPPVVEPKDLPPYLEYAFLEGDDKLLVIIAKNMKDEKKTALVKVLKLHKQALTWQLFDIKGINLKFCTHKILMEDDFKPAVQHQRRVNLQIYEVIKKETHTIKKIPPSRALMERLPTVACLSAYVMDREAVDILKTMDPPGDIMAQTTLPKRCFTPVSTGPQSIVMPMTWSNLVTLVNVREKYRNVIKCLKIPSKFERFLTYGASTSWGCSHLHEGTSIYSFGTPRTIISDRGTYFCNDQFAKVMLKYGVTHRLAIAYHPQTSGQVEVSNRGLKRILERTVGENCASWSDKLDDALWPFVQLLKHPSSVLLTSSYTERHVIYRSNSSTKLIGP